MKADGTDKALVSDAKLSLGSISGGFAAPGPELAIGEGIETALRDILAELRRCGLLDAHEIEQSEHELKKMARRRHDQKERGGHRGESWTTRTLQTSVVIDLIDDPPVQYLLEALNRAADGAAGRLYAFQSELPR